jgi:biopolymer transport protein ExbD
MKIGLRSHHTVLAALNITPLLDLVFVMLVIFIITTPQLMNNLELSLPSGATPPATPVPLLRVRVLNRDVIQWDAQELTLAGFKAELARRQVAQPNLAVVVQGGARADYQSVVDVLEAIQQLHITQVGLAPGPDTLQNEPSRP